jgi:hypothetical protein
MTLLEKLHLKSANPRKRAEPPRLTEPVRVPYGAFQFKCQVPEGLPYEIIASSNLKTWERIYSDRSQGEINFVDSDAAKLNYRFYRLTADGVLSSNMIGYVTVTLPPGFCILSNPLRPEDTRISTMFAAMPDGMTVSRFDARTHELSENKLEDRKWSNGLQRLAPGEGAIVFNPVSDYKSLSFVGEVLLGNFSVAIPAGFSLRGSMLPQPGRLDTDLEFPISEGDVVHIFDRDKQRYVFCSFLNGGWKPHPPVIAAGEGFWIAKKDGRNWMGTIPPIASHST